MVLLVATTLLLLPLLLLDPL
ncbi:hypothetical protein PPSIR1_35692 [Plesiocystis pacifica SIR-1]|uniref:Uncharacterized protein n=1 Tax=Plesiocystis pacifica SIR-1 TaxID=391625 RepID=A6G1R7_9BACT|nr:hypothetical protein PPSIR1_35692 [Plesiocystis pacifica SIR-1]